MRPSEFLGSIHKMWCMRVAGKHDFWIVIVGRIFAFGLYCFFIYHEISLFSSCCCCYCSVCFGYKISGFPLHYFIHLVSLGIRNNMIITHISFIEKHSTSNFLLHKKAVPQRKIFFCGTGPFACYLHLLI